MKAHFALNTRSEPQRCVLVPQLIFSHSLKQTIILTFDKLCINLIEFDHFATDFAYSNTGSIRDDPYWTSGENSSELVELSSINKVSVV